MMLYGILPTALFAATVSSPASAFCPSCQIASYGRSTSRLEGEAQSRGDFIFTAAVAIVGTSIVTPLQPAYARGRATLESSYDRYSPRIIEGGRFYRGQLFGAISKGDWKYIESATMEPPAKSKADRSLPDGGAAKRAALAGGFSDSRVLAAMDLFAATFSESSISPKTKAMKAEVEKLREVVEGLNKAARIAQGEEKGGGGGLFGIGAKATSKEELAKTVKDLYLKGGNAFNQYVFIANDGLPVQLAKLPFL
jgi:hypothetical protein